MPLAVGDRLYLLCTGAVRGGARAAAGAAPHLMADPTAAASERAVCAKWHDRGEWQQLEVGPWSAEPEPEPERD